MTALTELARAALVTPDAAGALADWLEEHGDHRGRLLRIRWRRFRTEYHRAAEADARKERRITEPVRRAIEAARAAGMVVEVGAVTAVVNDERAHVATGFNRYICERFAKELA